MPPKPIIYLDNNATTPVDPAVIEAMLPYLTERFGNPSSAYRFGSQVREAIERSREQTAALLGCEPREVVFTSGGTESDNAAIASALQLDPARRHIVTTAVEHSAVIKPCEILAKRGFDVTWLGVDQCGRLDLDELERAIRPDTAMVSVMWANNETGVIFPVEQIAEIVHAKGTLFHTDAVQATGKIPLALGKGRAIHFLSLSGHKIHAPKGVGALYVNRRARFKPYLLGGDQEESRRAGTENVAGIVALGKAAEMASQRLPLESTQVKALRDMFEDAVLEQVPGTRINGDRIHRLPNTASISFDGIESEGLLMLLDRAGVCCSAGSACATGSIHPSHVLLAMGFPRERARGSLRFSFSRLNTKEEVAKAVEAIAGAVAKLRQ